MKDPRRTCRTVAQQALVLFALLAAPAAAGVRYATFPPPAGGREGSYGVAPPPSYGGGDRRYPVVYALHGLFESHVFWERRGLAAALAPLRDKGEVPEF